MNVKNTPIFLVFILSCIFVNAQSLGFGKGIEVSLRIIKSEDDQVLRFSKIIDSLTLIAIDSIKKNNLAIAKYEPLNAPCRFKLLIESEVMKTEKAYDLPPTAYGNFEYLNRISLYNETNNVLLMKMDDIYKNLPDLVSNGKKELFEKIYKTLLKQTDIFIFNTQDEVFSSFNGEGLILNFSGIDKGIINSKEEANINVLINNLLVNQQRNFSFNYQPNYKKALTNEEIDIKKNNVINFNIKVIKQDNSYVFELIFKSGKALKLSQSGFEQSIHSTPIRLKFNIAENKILNGCYSELIFDINKSLYKFLLFNLESKN